jgi:nucleoside-diphosphate-sugar epimerase
MSSIVAVAGGSGGLGRAIIDALKASSKYEPLILSRKVRLKCCLHSSNLNFLLVG